MSLVPGVLDGAEGVLSELLAQADLLGFGLNPGLHGFEQMFVDPAGDAAPALVACAIGFKGTLAAGAGGVIADLPLLLDGCEPIGQGLAGRAPVAVLIGVIAEVFFGEEAARAVGGGGGFWHVRGG